MKSHISILVHHYRAMLIAVAFFGMISTGQSQTDNEATNTGATIADTITVEEEEAEEKPSLRMTFESFKINDQVKIMARVRAKVDSKWHNKAYVEVSFYKDEVTPSNLIGKDTSNVKGEASLILDAPHESTTYIASIKDNPDYADAEETVTYNPSVMNIELTEEDSVRYVKVFVGIPNDSGVVVPVPETEVKIYVQRLFGTMPLGDPETTDEEGNVTVEFPAGIPGDTAGTITIVAKIAEHELLGNVETSKSISWGDPVVSEDFYSKRQLWSARANSPIALVVIVNIVLLGIWGVIFYIFWQIIKINKIGKANKIAKV